MGTFTQKQRKIIAKNIRKSIDELCPDKDQRQELARHLGVSLATLSNWTRENRTPQIKHLYKMSKVFDIPLHQLCGLPKQPPIRTSELSSDVIIQMATCKNRQGKPLFHKIPRNKIPESIILIFNEIHSATNYLENTKSRNNARKNTFTFDLG